MNFYDIFTNIKSILFIKRKKEDVESINMKNEEYNAEQIEDFNHEDLSSELDEEWWELYDAMQNEKEKKSKNLFDNSKFMKKIDAIMRHNHDKNEYYYHGTSLENAEKIIKNGLYLRDGKDLSVTAVREFDELGLFAIRDELTEEEVFELEKKNLIEYDRGNGIGTECVVIIDKPKNIVNIVEQVDDISNIQVVSQYVLNKPKGLVNSKWIVGYIDKINGDVSLNPLYYDYNRISEQYSTVFECDAVKDTKSKINVQNQQTSLPSRKTNASKWSCCYKRVCKRKCYN